MGASTRKHYGTGRPLEARIGFSRAVRIGDVIEVSGTAPTAPDGSTIAPGDAYEQAKAVFAIIGQALAALGGTLGDVVRTRIFLTDADDWQAVGRAHGEVFAGVRPAATMLEVSRLLSPDWRVEIEATAVVGSG
ncbi:MAG TPA: RidA family protein [Dehalococcoidia bacterium]|nr:RidA family protein [Dehalococcoidia bacterium]